MSRHNPCIASRRPSIRDLARETGLSTATVSQALNGMGRIPEATRRRVQEAAEQIGYRANVHARSLVTGRNMTFGVQVAGGDSATLLPQSGYFLELLNSASAAANERGYALVLTPPAVDRDSVARLAIDGAVIVDPTGAESLLELGPADGVPIVTAGRLPDAANGPAWVDNDHRAGTTEVLEHFWASGHRKPALLTSTGRQSYLADALAAYRDWCDRHGQEPLAVTAGRASNPNAAAEAALRMLGAENPPDAVFATLDELAVGVLRAARRLGLRVPDDLALAALTDSELMRATEPQITAIDLMPAEIGRASVALLTDLVERKQPSRGHQTVPSRLVLRGSTAAP
jgi:DNA-binding LacI/PurR family transcriptional regulator